MHHILLSGIQSAGGENLVGHLNSSEDIETAIANLVEVIDTIRRLHCTSERIQAHRNRLPGWVVDKICRRHGLRRRY